MCQNGLSVATVTFDNQVSRYINRRTMTAQVLNKQKYGKRRGHSISVVTHATCNGETATYSTGARKVAILYKKEGGGTFCLNN